MTQKNTLWFLFHENRLVLQVDDHGKPGIPQGAEPPLPCSPMRHTIGMIGALPCVAAEVTCPPEGTEYVRMGLRASFDILGEPLYRMAGKGWEMLHWDSNSRFCSACGTPTLLQTPVSKICPGCKKQMFPSISVAILALVRRENSVLLVRAHNFIGPYYGLVAGFLETGETLEECVHREVFEETGLRVCNVTYFDSQPWPYPSGLMAGFIADYQEGELCLQQEELSHGEFFTADSLPQIPHKLSLARRMIDWWSEGR